MWAFFPYEEAQVNKTQNNIVLHTKYAELWSGRFMFISK